MFPIKGKRSQKEKSMLPLHAAMKKQPEMAPLYAAHAHEYGAKEAHRIEEISASRSWWRVLTFGWLHTVLERGNSRQLTDHDVFSLSDAHETTQPSAQVETAWASERHKNGREASLVMVLLKCFGCRILTVAGLQACHQVASISIPPLVLQAIVGYALDQNASAVIPTAIALALIVGGVAMAVLRHQSEYLSAELSTRVEASIASLAFSHLLVVSPSVLQRTATESIVGYVIDDAATLGRGTMAIANVVGIAFQIATGGSMLWGLAGNALWVGVLVLIAAAPVIGVMTNRITASQTPVNNARAEWLKSARALFSSIKTVKLMTWEKYFVARAVELRDTELRVTRALYVTLACSQAFINAIAAFICVGALLSCTVFAGIKLNVSSTFAILLLIIQLLSGPISRMPRLLVDLGVYIRAARRLNLFLKEAERSKSQSSSAISGVGVVIKNADFKWDCAVQEKTDLDLLLEAQGIAMETGAAPALHHINFYAEPGEIHAVVGSPESGKSTFLGGIIGLVRCCAGEVNVHGSLAFINQEPFLIGANIRDNVCFGLPFDEDRYHNAVSVSGLKYDLRVFPHGDQTKAVGSNFHLTPAQRIRIALARVIYQDADVYVIDDIFSAMEDGISTKIFKKCFKNALQKKIVIMATSSLRFLEQCDNVIVLSLGTVVEAGSFQSLMAKKKWGILAELMRAQGKKNVVTALCSCDNTEESNDLDDDFYGLDSRTLVTTVDGGNATTDTDEGPGEENILVTVGLWLARCFGGGGYGLCILMFLIVLATSLCQLYALQWSTKLVSGETTFQGLVVLSISNLMLHLASSWLYYWRSLHAGHHIFEVLIDRLACAPTVFFDSTSYNHLSNQLSRDIRALDIGFTHTWLPLLRSSTHLLISSCLLIKLSPWLIILLALSVAGVCYATELQAKPARDLDRIRQSLRSQIEDCITEVLGGMTTIRLHKADHLYAPRLQQSVEKLRQTTVLRACTDAWLGMRVDTIFVSLVAGVCLMAVDLHRGTATMGAAEKIGIAFFVLVTLPSSASEFLAACEDLRVILVAGARVKAYSKMPTEAALDSMPELRPRADWPTAGAVEFDNVSLRYKEGLPRVLRGVSLSVNAGGRVAVIGQAGAGRRTLFNAITRLVELTSGSISIDGVDVSKIGLHDLRSKIAVLCADPILIPGTIRMNLDPTYCHPDDALWSVLKRVHLNGVVLSLDELVKDGGGNYSIGERHLLVISRAILHRPKIVLVEESDLVASEDIPEAQLIKTCLRQEFEDCTVITITEQTATAMDATHTVVMDNGQIIETGPTKELDKSTKSIYRTMLEDWKRRDHGRPPRKLET